MGGFGSGTWHRSGKRTTLEECNRVELNWMKRTGMLRSGTTGTLSWSCGGEERGSIGFDVWSDFIRFRYRVTPWDAEPYDVARCASFDYTRCHIGGRRLWSLCPDCRRRVGVLVVSGPRIACRHCSRVIYACQAESRSDRAARKLRKIQRRLGNPDYENVLDLYLPKPKRMRWRTYDRIVAKAEKPWRLLEAEAANLNLLELLRLC